MRIDADLLIPGRGGPVPSGTVIIDGARIAYAGPRDKAPRSGDAAITVATVMPGMWGSTEDEKVADCENPESASVTCGGSAPVVNVQLYPRLTWPYASCAPGSSSTVYVVDVFRATLAFRVGSGTGNCYGLPSTS